MLARALIAIVALLPCTAAAALEFAGDVLATTVGPGRVDLQLAGGPVARVEVVSIDTVRVRLNHTGVLSTRVSGAIAGARPGAPTIVTNLAETAYIVAPSLSVIVRKRPFGVIVLRSDGTAVTRDAVPAAGWDRAGGYAFNRFSIGPDEHVFGLGLRGGPIDRRGRVFYMKNVDAGGYGEFSDPLYSSTPFYYGLHGGRSYGVFLDAPALPFFDVDSQGQNIVTIGAFQPEIDYYVFVGPRPADVARAFGDLTGHSPLPARWTLGYHQSRFGYATQAEYLELASTFRQLAIPCDALYYDIDYLDRLRAFTWHPQNFPSPLALNATLASMGFRRIGSTPAVFRTDDPLWPYLDASAFLLRDVAGRSVVNNIFYGDVSWFDFTRPAARDWYRQRLRLFMMTGLDGLWNDLNEPAASYMTDALYDFGGEARTDLEARNLYALQEVSLTHRAQLDLRPDSRPFILSRSGYPGIQRYAANWSGDTLTSFDSLRVNIQTSISMGLSGQNQFGHDVGGFLGAPSAELFTRWLQFASLTTYFRTHSVHVVPHREPWRFGEPWTGINRKAIEQRYRWMPYLYTLHEEASRTGAPVLAPTFFHFPGDPGTVAQDTEYMLGTSLLVAPVHVEGATTRSAYLPSGTGWIDVATGTAYAGGQTVVVPAPVDRIPVFVRAGALLPSGPVVQHADAPAEPWLALDVYAGPDSSFQLYEDDGNSRGYLRGAFRRTTFTKRETPAGIELGIGRTGTWTPPQRMWRLRFHGFATAPTAVMVGATPLAQAPSEAALEAAVPGWYHRPADGVVLVTMPEAPAPFVVRLARS